jgi:hypothetical protein
VNYRRGKPKNSEKETCPRATLSVIDLTWTDIEANPGFRGDRSAANRLSHGMALLSLIIPRNCRLLQFTKAVRY